MVPHSRISDSSQIAGQRMSKARQIIETLQLERHPVCGWFGKNFRERSLDGGGSLSAIYLLLRKRATSFLAQARLA